MINMYRTNNVSKLSPDQIACINLVRDLFIKADPVSVNISKRFETDEELIEYYANMEKKYGGTIKLTGSHGIFDKSFVISPIMKSYADKFYKRRLALAASHLSDVVKYQIASAVTHNKPLPLINNDATVEYLQTLYHKTDIAPNIKKTIVDKTNERLNVCYDTINNVIEDVLFGSHDGYYVNTCLNANNKTAVHRFRDNITYLLNSPLTLSVNIFNLIENKALQNGQNKDVDYSKISTTHTPSTPINQHLSEMAFENEALRRAKIQEMNIRYENILNR
nr:gp41 [Darna trima granulovirus]